MCEAPVGAGRSHRSLRRSGQAPTHSTPPSTGGEPRSAWWMARRAPTCARTPTDNGTTTCSPCHSARDSGGRGRGAGRPLRASALARRCGRREVRLRGLWGSDFAIAYIAEGRLPRCRGALGIAWGQSEAGGGFFAALRMTGESEGLPWSHTGRSAMERRIVTPSHSPHAR